MLAQAPVTELLDSAAAAHPDRTALVHADERISYAELAERVERAAGALAVAPGDAVGLVLPNGPEFVVAFLAILRAGAVAVPLNPAFKQAEREFHFRESGVAAVVTEEPAGGGAAPAVARDADADAVFQYSSGSTGRPKRVPRTHAQLRAEVDAYVRATGMGPGDVVFCAIPLHHTYGMGCCLLASVHAGSTLVLFDQPSPLVLQRGRALELIERERATVFPAVPYTFRLLADAPEGGDLSSLRLCISAAAKLPRATLRAFEGRFRVPVRELYGCTEAGAVTVDMSARPEPGSVGLPLDGVEVRIVGAEGELLDTGRVGEIHFRGPGMTAGYAGPGDLNRDAFRDGFFASGDRGRLDDEGRLHVTGREKLLIDVRGDKVDPIEVEDVLAVHPKVEQVVVVGVPSDADGEEHVKAVVVPAGECGERELIRYCRERLADYKVPARVEFRDEIPLSAAGKVLRKYLLD
ncbi:MAG: AMP-binding protein [Thermoleophilaceae bacterium]|nr:AMP-binding protein [Thermoleophilaceae bacterium]